MASLAKRGAGLLRSFRLRLEKTRFSRLSSLLVGLLILLFLALTFITIVEILVHVHYHGVTLLVFLWSTLFGSDPSAQRGTSNSIPGSIVDPGLAGHNATNPRVMTEDPEKMEAVRGMMRHAWDGYAKYAWGRDELKPLSQKGAKTFGGCTAITIIDSLDTLYIMGLTKEYNAAENWIFNKLDFGCVTTFESAFETTIRSLGSMMSMFHLTNKKKYAQLAEDLGSRLLSQFDEKGSVPAVSCQLSRSKCQGSFSNLAEAGTLQLEWRALGAATTNPKLVNGRRLAELAMHSIMRSTGETIPGQQVSNHDTGKVRFSGDVSMAGSSDSYFEYLVKIHIQGGSNVSESHYRAMFEKMMKVTLRDLIRKDHGMWRVIHSHPTRDIMDHLACFLPGSLAVAANMPGSGLNGKERDTFMEAAAHLTETCYNMYHMSPSGLAPETVMFDLGKMKPGGARYNIQRPEAVESIFYMWRLTGDPKYRAWNWEIFQSFEKHLKVKGGGYGGTEDAWVEKPVISDSMSSFFLAETMKYLFLTFSNDSVIPLDKWVFNTEAHPLLVDPTLGSNPVPYSPKETSKS